ncbi:MAG: YebC/PmpR family DNA-binding transcriptional regulator [Candidatus Kerfeldbacteria bacterium]|nr:YebC/PmpR family DNA-binding transcriptional regulator [Candidatus Kerfeldbacteria bacterium]
MSGHSKWSTIKRAKGLADAKRSQVFTKLANAISVAAKGGADVAMNSKLRLAVERARAMSMPKDNIERAIQKGAGGGEGLSLEEVRYEAYGPGGVAFLIDALTNNRNRTSANIRHLLEGHGGRLAEAGSVAWMFAIKGLILIPEPANRDEVELALIEAGAEDFVERETELEITCAPTAFETIKAKLTELGITPVYSSIEPVAKTTVTAEGNTAQQLETLREVLDEDEDITDLFDNEA